MVHNAKVHIQMVCTFVYHLKKVLKIKSKLLITWQKWIYVLQIYVLIFYQILMKIDVEELVILINIFLQ